MFVNSQGPIPAMSLAFPDVLLVPPLEIPVPFPNVSLSPTAIPTCYTVFIMCMPAHNIATERPVTITGVGLGALCGDDFGPQENDMGSTNLFLGGPPAVKMTLPTMQNLINSFGFHLTPSQIVMLCLA
jgi:hypothetical protein